MTLFEEHPLANVQGEKKKKSKIDNAKKWPSARQTLYECVLAHAREKLKNNHQ